MPRKDLFYPWGAWYTGSLAEAIAIGDVNGDGKNEILMTNVWSPDEECHLAVFGYDKSGQLLAPVKYPVPNGVASMGTVDIGDVNNDGRADAVVEAGLKTVGFEVFTQDGSGALNPAVAYPGNYISKVKIGDFNNDGLLDVAEVESSDGGKLPQMKVFLQNAKGFLDPASSHYIPYQLGVSMATGDVNGDGLTDTVLIGRQGTCPNISVFTQKADGTLSDPRYYCSVYGGIWGVAVGDVNADGLQDVVFTYAGGALIGMLLQKPDGTFAPEITYDSYAWPEAVRIADLNNDGRNDIIVLHGNHADLNGTYVGFLLQDADGTLMPEEVYDVGYATQYNPDGLAVGDFNGDGLPDIAIANYNYGLIFLTRKALDPHRCGLV